MDSLPGTRHYFKYFSVCKAICGIGIIIRISRSRTRGWDSLNNLPKVTFSLDKKNQCMNQSCLIHQARFLAPASISPRTGVLLSPLICLALQSLKPDLTSELSDIGLQPQVLILLNGPLINVPCSWISWYPKFVSSRSLLYTSLIIH